ncbi:Uncharacterised protein [Klebsiella grimontii]|uniref:Uncharacterized protein n=1 Tax=Klebsiella grimontii TaxID=2058152 RepID=A0A7H4P979_9ENTR|nr:Uncharacterised protein [Klebsiella grimontii]
MQRSELLTQSAGRSVLREPGANLFGIQRQPGGRQFAQPAVGFRQAQLYRGLLLRIASLLLESGTPAGQRVAPQLKAVMLFKPYGQRLLTAVKLLILLPGGEANTRPQPQSVM